MSHSKTIRYLLLATALGLVAASASADFNWAVLLPGDARLPGVRGAKGGDPDKDCIWSTGTIIQCISQTLAETVPLTGTSFELHYSADRMPGRKDAYTLQIPLSGSDVPASMRRIDLDIWVAGQQVLKSFPPLPNQSTTFTWDGNDAYGRPFHSGAVATVRIGHIFPRGYAQPPAAYQSSFGLPSPNNGLAFVTTASTEAGIFQQNTYFLGAIPGPIGGWTLSTHHAYNPISKTLLLGDGSRRSTQATSGVINTVAGSPSGLPTGDGPAKTIQLHGVEAVAIAPDGTFFLIDFGSSCIRRVELNGYMYHVTACGGAGYGGDGGFAGTAFLSNPGDLALGRDGSIYIADCGNNRIRRIDPNGIITTFAGNGTGGFSGDGGRATDAELSCPLGVATAPDGAVYIGDNNRIRRIGLDGMITTVAGNGTVGFSGDGGPATQAALGGLQAGNVISVAPSGNIYLVDPFNRRVRRIGIDGIITTVAGNGASGSEGDGGPATQATLKFPLAVAVAADESFYIADLGFIRYVGADGIIHTVAGNGVSTLSGDGGPAAAAGGIFGRGLAVTPDGSILHGEDNVVRQIAPTLPGFAGSDLAIPSEDGSELYHFDASGRHLQTLNALTGTVRYQFAYDSNGRLTGLTDGDGNVTTINRDANGNPIAIVAPSGQITTLAVDANGYLSSIANPAGEAFSFTYTPDGLLTSETDPRGGVHTLTYDALGRLIRDEDPAGGVTTLARVDTSNGHQTTITTGMGRSATTTYENLPTGEIRRINTDDTGAQTTVVSALDGSINVTYPDGAHTTIQQGPDPRFGMLAPVYKSITHSVPGGPTLTQTTQRTATLADPNNPLSLQSLTETVSINGRTFTNVYDAASRTATWTSPEGRKTVDIIDSQQRTVSKQLAPELTPITATFDAQGRIIHRGQGAQGFDFTYDNANRVVSRVDGLGNKTTYTYDDANRVTHVTLPSGRHLQFAYDANGNRTQVILPSGAIHTLAYTPVDLEASYTPPGNASYVQSYNGDRDLTTSMLPGGRSVQTTYDAVGRDSAYTYPEAAAAFAYSPGDSTKRLAQTTWAPTVGTTQTQAFTYTGSYVTGATWSGVAQGQFSYAYDNNFAMTAMQLGSNADNVQIPLVRDREELITGYGPFSLQRGGPAGAVNQIGDGSLAATLTYDALGQITTGLQSVAGQPTFQSQYVYDAAGQITQKVETVSGSIHTYNYSYDADGQLTQVSRDGVVTESYAYDANGNRLSRQTSGNPVETASFDAQDRLIQRGSTTYQFDVDGFLAERNTDTFFYSARGELLRATVGGQTVTYTYDGIGRRVGRTTSAGTAQYFYGEPGNPFLLTHVRDATGILSTLFYDEGGVVFALERGSAFFYVATDLAGTPRLVSDSTGQVVEALEFDAFGNLLSDSNPGFELPIGFAGGLADALTGLVHFGFRDYEPASGRWTARDPVRFAAGQGNLFGYVNNDPVNLRDPMGLWCVGASAYLGLGGGAQLCCHGFFGGCTACVEAGVGLGAAGKLDGSIGASSGDVKTGASVGVEGKVGCGTASLGGELTFDSSGCLRGKIKAGLGPAGYEGGNVGAKAKIERMEDVGVNWDVSCKAQAKARAKLCV